MKTWRRAVMDVPEPDRLETALMWLEMMAGGGAHRVGAFQKELGLSPQVAQLVEALDTAAPRMLTKGQLYRVLYPNDDDVEMKIVDVLICRARTRLPRGAIITHWGQGYSMAAPLGVEVPGLPLPVLPEKHRVDWSAQDDAELLRMWGLGSSYAAMAEELDRSPRAIENRLQVLRGQGRVSGVIQRAAT